MVPGDLINLPTHQLPIRQPLVALTKTHEGIGFDHITNSSFTKILGKRQIPSKQKCFHDVFLIF